MRTLTKQIEEPIGSEKGFLLETYLLHELTCYSDYNLKRWEFNYWATPSENEVDFIISKGTKRIGIEVKASKKWDKKFNKGLNTLLETKKITKAYGVYLGDEKIKSGEILVYPIKKFITSLFNKEIDF